MAKMKAVWGIDVGHCALKAIKLVMTEQGDVALVGQDYIEHAKILSQSDADPHELISKALEKFLSRNDITEDGVVSCVPGKHTLARFSKLPPVDPKKIPDIVQFEANQQIPFDMDEVIWDYQTFSEAESPEIEVGIFAMKRDLIHEHLAHFSDAGIEPMLVQSAPLALHDGMFYDGQCSDQTTVIVDIGAENTDLVITDKVRIWTRTIPIGGNNFTDALATGFKLSFSKAENLKRQAASSKYARQIFQAMRPVFADLVGEIQRSIGFYTSTHRESTLNRMIGMGNAFKLPGLQKYLQQNLGLTVVRPSKFLKLKVAPGIEPAYEEQVLSFGVAYGLALEGLGQGMITSNLLPPEIARQAVWRRKKPWFAAAAACLAISCGVVWMRQSTDAGVLANNRGAAVGNLVYDRAAQLLDRLPSPDTPPREYANIALAAAKAVGAEFKQKEQLGKQQAEDCALVVSLLEDRELWIEILQTVHAALPEQPELDAPDTAQDYVQTLLANLNTLPRSKRSEIIIDALESTYVPDVYAADYRDPDTLEADREQLFDYYATSGVPGFLITLNCLTPNGDKGKFIEKRGGFIQRLREVGQDPARPFYFDGVRMVGSSGTRGGPLGSGGKIGGSRPASGRFRGAPNPSPTPPAGLTPKGALDPLTFEDTSDDWSFTVKLVVALGPLPEEKSPGTPGAAGVHGGPPAARGGADGERPSPRGGGRGGR